MAQPHRRRAKTLGAQHAGQPRDLLARRRFARLAQVHGHVVALDDVELHVHQVTRGVDPETPHDHEPDRQRHAEDRQRRAPRAPRQVAQDHPQRRRQQRGGAAALDQPGAKAGRRLGAHRFGRRQRRGATRRPQRANTGRDEPDQRRLEQHRRGRLERQARKVEIVSVEAGHQPAEPDSRRHPDDRPDRDRRDRERQVEQPDGEVGIAESLEQPDLRALRAHQAREHRVEQEGRHRQEQRRDPGRGDLDLAELVGEEPVRDLVAPGIGAQPAVRLEQAVEAIDDVLRHRAGRQRERHVVERSVHLERRGEGRTAHPQHAEVAVVGKHDARADLVDVLGRQREPDDRELRPAAVQYRADRVAHAQAVGLGEGPARDRLVVAAGLDVAARAQCKVVEHRLAPRRDRHQPPGRRLGQAGHVQRHVGHDARVDRRDAGNRADALRQRLRRPFQVREHVGEAVARVVVVLGDDQRVVGAAHRDECRDAAGDDQRGRDHLPAQVPELAQHDAHERAHHEISDGDARVALRSMPTMRPLPIRMTRSAIAAIAALCVISTVIVPSSRFTRSSTSSTSLPVG